MMMTFHESYGQLPMRLLRTYKKANVSPADHDLILDRFGYDWSDDIPADIWEGIAKFVSLSIQDGLYRPSRYL